MQDSSNLKNPDIFNSSSHLQNSVLQNSCSDSYMQNAQENTYNVDLFIGKFQFSSFL